MPIPALTEITLEVEPGEVIGVLGANGAGKTTLLEILATLLLPTSGSAAIFDLDVVADAAAVRRAIGYSPADANSFYPRLTGLENLRFFGALYGLARRQTDVRIAELGTTLGIDITDARPFQQLPDGIRQRLSLARALLPSPRLLLLDEPTRSLDPPTQAVVRRFIRDRLAGGTTVVMVTHNTAEAVEVCDRAVVIARGRIASVRPAAELTGTEVAPAAPGGQ
jgi:ABC-2 type transport system ATP-binding protein